MLDYERLYGILFNGITDALESMENGDIARAMEMLIGAQMAAEDYYIEGDEEDGGPLFILPHDNL